MIPNDSSKEMIAHRLRIAREQAGLSQGQVARLMELHRPAISELEAGRRRVAADELAKLADLYGVSIAWVTGASPEVASPADGRIAFAARELSKLHKEDFDKVMRLIASIQNAREPGEAK